MRGDGHGSRCPNQPSPEVHLGLDHVRGAPGRQHQQVFERKVAVDDRIEACDPDDAIQAAAVTFGACAGWLIAKGTDT